VPGYPEVATPGWPGGARPESRPPPAVGQEPKPVQRRRRPSATRERNEPGRATDRVLCFVRVFCCRQALIKAEMAITDEQSSMVTLTRKLVVESADLVGQTSDENDPVYTFNRS